MGRAVEFQPVAQWHQDALAATLRPADALELEALGVAPPAAIRDSLAESTLATALVVDGQVLCVAGLVPSRGILGAHTAQVWMLTSSLTSSYALAFARAAKQWIAQAHTLFLTLHQLVDSRHQDALRFARMLGFELGTSLRCGPRAQPFVIITSRR